MGAAVVRACVSTIFAMLTRTTPTNRLLSTCLRIFSAHAFVSFGTAALWHSGQRTLHVSRNNHVLLSLAVPLTLCLSVSPSTVLS